MKAVGIGLVIGLAMAGSAMAQSISALEDTLFTYEQIVGEALGPEAARCLAADSSRWNTALGQACLGDSCHVAAYADRLSSLLTFLPEAGPVEGVDFVTTPQLVTILAPEPEAMDPDDFAPLDTEIIGTLSHASADPNAMGLAASDQTGDHVIVFDIDIGNQAGHATLQSLIADEPGQSFLVRGASDDNGNFSASQCRLVYRMPIPDN